MLPDQAFHVLRLLLQREGELVTRDELKRLLWPNGTVVEFDHGINSTIKKLRRALNDSAEEPQYIETIPRRGYRLMVAVEWVVADDSSGGQASSESYSAPSESDASVDADALPNARLEVGRLTGKVVSHYRVLEVIGGGGMGVVYRAEDLKLGRAVALKFLPEEVGDDSKARERFEREAHAVSALDHPNICTVYDFDEFEGHPFIAMQLLQGKTLRDHIADGRFRLPEPEGLEIAIQIASGLETAHEKGIIHRDIKPANIFVTEKNVAKILDFGVAKVIQLSEPADAVILCEERTDESKAPYSDGDSGVGVLRLPSAASGLTPFGMTNENQAAAAAPAKAETSLTRTGMKLGTAGYMSPEQVRGEPLDARTDIFSFGLVLYEMATGECAFTGETEAIVNDAILNQTAASVRDRNPQISSKLEGVIHNALEKDRERRYQGVAQMRAFLQQSIAQVPLRPRNWLRYAAAALLVAVASVGLFHWRSRLKIKFTDKDTIVWAHFQNFTGDTVMDDALDWPLERELSQSPYLKLLYSNKVRDTLKQSNVANLPTSPLGPKLTPDLARDVCLRTHSRAIVTASIANVGNDYHIILKVEDCHSGKSMAKVDAETSDRNQIVHTLGMAGQQLRRDLGEPEESLSRFNTPLENDTSSSLEALQAYQEGMRLRFEKGNAEAIPELKRAVQLDPNLMAAHLNLAGAEMSELPPEEWMGQLTTAYNLRERLSPRFRWFAESGYYMLVTGELEKAKAGLEQWVSTFPEDLPAHNILSHCLQRLGEYERSAAEAREAIRLAPSITTYDQ